MNELSDEDVVAKVKQELKELADQLFKLPLIKENRDVRLKLNGVKESKEAELHAAERKLRIVALRKQLEELGREKPPAATPPRAPGGRIERLKITNALRDELETLLREAGAQ